jgi:hypothetical protein
MGGLDGFASGVRRANAAHGHVPTSEWAAQHMRGMRCIDSMHGVGPESVSIRVARVTAAVRLPS